QLTLFPKPDLHGALRAVDQNIGLILTPAMRRVAVDIIEVALPFERSNGREVDLEHLHLGAQQRPKSGGYFAFIEQVDVVFGVTARIATNLRAQVVQVQRHTRHWLRIRDLWRRNAAARARAEAVAAEQGRVDRIQTFALLRIG